MGDPAEENDPPPESRVFFAKAAFQVNKKCDECVTKFFIEPERPDKSGITM
jgi:hypothetical protein